MSSEWVRADSAPNVTEAALLRAALEAHDIEVGTRGEHLPSIAGQLPVTEAQVELWVRRVDLDRAREVLARVREPAAQLPPKTCPNCDEENPGNFDLCWKCEWPLPRSETAPVATLAVVASPMRRSAPLLLGAALLAAGLLYLLGYRASGRSTEPPRATVPARAAEK